MIKTKANFKINKDNRSINPLIWVLFVGYIVLSRLVYQIFNIEASRLSGVILLIPVVLMLLVSLLISKWTIAISFSYFHIHILVFGLFCIASSLWAESPSLAVSKGIDIIEIFIIMMIISICFHKTDLVDYFLKAIMWAYYIVVIYEIVFYGWGYFVEIMRDSSRVTSEFLNANTLGMCASFAILINLYLVLSKKITVWSLVLAVLSIVVVAASGSRKALLSLVLGVFIYFLIRSFRKDQRTIPLIRFLIALPIFIIVIYQVLQLPVFNGIMGRVTGLINYYTLGVGDKSSMIRMQLVQLGIRLFKEHPVLGIGIDNPRLHTFGIVGKSYYLHNNYVELLASGGIVGTIIYYSIFAKLLFSYIKRRNFDDHQYCICFVLLLLTLVLDYGMVSYYSKSTFIFLLLFMKFDDKLKNR